MPQKFLSITNFDKYQKTKNKDGERPWVKLWKKLLDDPQFMKLSPTYRFIYTGLILLADDCNNRIYADSTYLRQRLYMTHTEGIHGAYIGQTLLDLKPLYRAGFLETSNLSRVLSEERRGEAEERRGEDIGAVPPTPPNPHLSKRQKLEAFVIEEADRTWAQEELSIANAEHYVDEFLDYWRALDDKKLKTDWHATFRNRLRYLKEHNQLKTDVWT